MPADFHRAAKPTSNEFGPAIFGAHPVEPGRNVNGVNTYTRDSTSSRLTDFCGVYEKFANETVKGRYPNPEGVLKRNLILHLGYLFSGQPKLVGCQQVFPYGQLSESELD